MGAPKFVGVGNYTKLFGDSSFWRALSNTVYYTALVTTILTVLGLLLGMLLNSRLKGRIFARTIVLLPYVISSAAAGILWKWIYDKNFGILNSYLRVIGISSPPGWLSDPKLAIPSIVIMNSWWSVAFNTIVYLAALQGIPEELYEAAEIDGAGSLAKFRFVTLPLLRHTTVYVVVLCWANSFQVFDEIYVMTQGGPVESTVTLVFKIFATAFNNFEIGYASAISAITLVLILLASLFQLKVGVFRGEEK